MNETAPVQKQDIDRLMQLLRQIVDALKSHQAPRRYTVDWRYGDEGGRGSVVVDAYDAKDALTQATANWEEVSFKRIVSVTPTPQP